MSQSSIDNGGEVTGRPLVSTSCSLTSPVPADEGRIALLGATSAATFPDKTGFYGKPGCTEDWSRLRRRRNSVYLKNARSCIDYMLYAHYELARGRPPKELPHFRIKTREDALLLCAQFSRMSADQLVKCMRYADFDYAKEVLCTKKKTVVAQGDVFMDRAASVDTRAVLSIERASRNELTSRVWPQEGNDNSGSSCLVNMDVSFLNISPIVETHQESDASRGPTHTINDRQAEPEHPTYSPNQATRYDICSVKCTGNSGINEHSCSSYMTKAGISGHDFSQQVINIDALADAVQTRGDATPWPKTARRKQPRDARGVQVGKMCEPAQMQSHKLRQRNPLERHEKARSEKLSYRSCGTFALSESMGDTPGLSVRNDYTQRAEIHGRPAVSNCTHGQRFEQQHDPGPPEHHQQLHPGSLGSEERKSRDRHHTSGYNIAVVTSPESHNMATVTCPEKHSMAAVTCPERKMTAVTCPEKMAAVTCPEIHKMEPVFSEKMSGERSADTQLDSSVMPEAVTNNRPYLQHQQLATMNRARQCPHIQGARAAAERPRSPRGPACQQQPVARRRHTVPPQTPISSLQDGRAWYGLDVVEDVNTDTRPRPQLWLDGHIHTGSRPGQRIIANTTTGKVRATDRQGYSETTDHFVQPATQDLWPQLAAQTEHISRATHQYRLAMAGADSSAYDLTDDVAESGRCAGSSFNKQVGILHVDKSNTAEQEASSTLHSVVSLASATVGKPVPVCGSRRSFGRARSCTVSESMDHVKDTHPARHLTGEASGPAFYQTGPTRGPPAVNGSTPHSQTLPPGQYLHPSTGRESLVAKHSRLGMIGRFVSAMVAASSRTGQVLMTGLRGLHTQQAKQSALQKTPGGLPIQSVAKPPFVSVVQRSNSQGGYGHKHGNINDNHDVENDEDDYDISTVYSSGRMEDPPGDDDDNDDDDVEFISGRGFSFVAKDRADVEDEESTKDKKIVWEAAGDKKKKKAKKKDDAVRIKKAQEEAALRAVQLSAELARMREEEQLARQIERFHVPLFIMYILVILYVLMGAVVFFLWDKELEFWDSLYFIYVMLSTTGFGDLLPKPNMYAFIVVYGLVGMALYNIMINATLELFMEVLEYLAALGSSSKTKK